ncbi:MAG: ABC transporter ATP-binding protein [Anaerolineae bacterium]|nr:ABC transporter ATP-binding protein [Anaerolineae bacterium]
MSDKAIVTENLSRRFGEILAVDQLSLTIAKGEVFGFLGPNGAGKTTTVRMLTALIAPSEGKAWVNGIALGRDDTAIRKSVGLLTETPGLYEQLSAARNLEIFAELYEVADVAGQVEKFLRMLGLWERRNDQAGTFSKGMRQKLAIARALLHEPAIVFLDEPTSGLDPASARLVRDFIKLLKAEGRTIVLCTHNLDEADQLCDRIGVFRTRMIEVGTPAELRRNLFGRRVAFHLAEPAEVYLPLVQSNPSVTEALAVENKLLLRLADPETENPGLVRALVQAGANVQFVGELRHSLEDVYLQLVKEDDNE